MIGKFITFEGIDGAGKSIHTTFIADLLLRIYKKSVITTREPGGTNLGEDLRNIFLHQKMHVETEVLLMFALRCEHLIKIIKPALANGTWVICDRFTDSTFAYQGGGRNLSINKLEILEQWVHPHLQPDLTLLFDLPLTVARARLNKESKLDRFEEEQSDFFFAVRAEYLRRAKQFPKRFRILDATLSVIDIQQQITKILSSCINHS